MSAMEDDPYSRISRRELYRNPWLAVEVHEIVHPNGTPGEHVLVVTPPTCAVVVEDRGDLIFARQPRFAQRRSVMEIVKGGGESHESALESARRELREELGIKAREWSELGRLYEIPSIVSASVAVFLAREIELGPPEFEAVENICPVRLPIGVAIDAAVSGEIDDAITIAALFRFAVKGGHVARR
jgi:8-oxo-dGTP pyrophosphatase MutT (NUDIX family)